MKIDEIWAKYGKTDLMSSKLDYGPSTYRKYQNLWTDWYKGYVRKFHHYKVTNSDKTMWKDHRSLGMAKTACEEWARLIWSEKMQISVADEATNKTINDIFNHNSFQTRGKHATEVGFAVGMAAIVERVEDLKADPETGDIVECDNAKIKLDFINGRNIYPFTIDDDGIVEVGFMTRKGKKVAIQMHLLDDNGNYVIHNIKGDMNDRGDITYDENLDVYSFDTKSSLKWFQIIKANVVNNISIGSPLGISIIANAIPQLETCDICFDALPEELVLGRKRLYVQAEALKLSDDGTQTLTFDPNDAYYYTLPVGDKPTDKPYIFESNGALRITEITSAIQAALNLFSTKVGFGQDHYRYDSGGLTTATQVISEKSDMYGNLKGHELLIEQCIKDCIHTLIYICNTFTNNTCKVVCDGEINVKFDDSIIEDKNAEQTRDMQQVSQRLMSRVEYRVKYFGETPDVAAKSIAEIDSGQPTVVDIFSHA